jgi:mono/diheme cytochrome c family protein
MNWSAIGKILTIVVAIVAIVAIVALTAILRHGISARDEPTASERMIGRAARHMAIPMAARSMKNPIAMSDAVLAEGRAHWADHCATCHANDGSGKSEIGQHLYPKAPDMRDAATQTLGDGELFFIIKNGVRLTGMPAWGDAHSDDAGSWKLVHFIRHLPKITPDELKQMKGMNPISPLEAQEKKEEEEFLEGK